jgi:hypothetical protein
MDRSEEKRNGGSGRPRTEQGNFKERVKARGSRTPDGCSPGGLVAAPPIAVHGY